jgi:SpoIID/LytB domain protein
VRKRAAVLLVLWPALLPAWWFGGAGRAEREAGARFLAGDLSGAAQVLEPHAVKDPGAARELLALRFLSQDFKGVEDLALSRLDALDPAGRLTAARAAACRADWTGCLHHLDALPAQAPPMAAALRAEALQALGDSRAAEAMRTALSVTAGTRLEAATELLAGEAAESAGDAALAEARYKRAEQADPAFTMVHARLARLYQAQGRVKDARIRLERARRVDPDDEGLRRQLNELLAAAPGQVAALKREEADAKARFLRRANPLVKPHGRAPGEPLVRVGLLVEAPKFDLVLGGAFVDEASGRTLTACSAWLVHLAKGGGWELQRADNARGKIAAPLRFSDVLRLHPVDDSSTFGLHAVDAGAGYFWASKEDRYYRGLAELRPQGAKGVTLVNELGLESYLLSVVPSEIRPQWPAEALKAQAIAARTEAWRSLGRFQSKGYDLCPTVACAVYSGSEAEDPRSTAAVTATAGVVIQDGRGKLAPTFYMDNSGGHTQEAADAWAGEPAPKHPAERTAVLDAPGGSALAQDFPLSPAKLLAFIDDSESPAWGQNAETYRWTLRLSAAELEASVKRRHPAVLPLRTVLPLQRSSAGYVQKARFIGSGESVGSSDYIRTAIKGLKSNLFYVEPRFDADGKPLAFLFHGGGWGHGVGMAQSGARAMAAKGLNAKEILRHYFGAQSLKTRY